MLSAQACHQVLPEQLFGLGLGNAVVTQTLRALDTHAMNSCTYSSLAAVRACRDMLDASPGVSWNDIAGLAEAKAVLQENVILPLYMPEFFQGIRRPVKVPHTLYLCCDM